MKNMDSITIFNIIIAFGMFYVTYQQWRTNEKPLKQNLFDRRYEFLKNIQEFHMNGGYRNYNPDEDVSDEPHNRYLHGFDMGKFLIKEIDYKKICEIETSM